MKDMLCKRNQKKPIGYRFYTLLVTIAALVPLSTLAASSAKSISLSDAVTMTLTHHPDLRALVAKKRVWQGQMTQAGIAQRPQVGLMVEDAMGTGEHSALKSMQTTLTFSWLIQQQLIDGRVKAVKTQASELERQQQIKALDLSALVAKRFVDILVKQERMKLNQMAALEAQRLVAAMTKRVQAGKSSSVELHLAKAELIRRQLAVEDIEHELSASQYQLASLWGKPTERYHLNGDLLSLPAIPDVASQLAKLKCNPSVQQFATAQRIAQSKIELARIEAKPQWQLTTGLRRYESSDDFGLMVGVSIPWGDNSSKDGTIAALQAQQEVLASEQDALVQSMSAQIYVLLQEMAHSRHVIETVQTAITPTLEQAMSEANNAFDQGQLSYTQYSDVRRELLSVQAQLLEAYESLHLQHIEIQRLTGTTLTQ